MNTRPFFIACLLIFSCCYAVSNELFQGAISAKSFYFHAVGIMLLVPTVVYHFYSPNQHNSRKVTLNTLDILVVAFAGYTTFCIWGNPLLQWFTEHIFTTSLLVCLYAFFKIGLRNPKNRIAALSGLFLVTFGEIVYGILQMYGYASSLHPTFSVSGSFFNPAPYAGFLGLIFPIALSVVITPSFRQRKVFLLISLLVVGGVISLLPAIQSRAAWLAMGVGSAVVIGYHFRFFSKVRAELVSPIMQLVALVICVFLVGLLGLGLFYLRPESVLGRVLIGKINILMIIDHPWVGVGYDQYQSSFGAYQAAYFEQHPSDPLAGRAGNGEYAFNIFLRIAVEQGLIGLILFGILLIAAFRVIFITPNTLIVAIGASLLALLSFGLFSYPFSVLPIQTTFIFLLAFLSTSHHDENRISVPSYLFKPHYFYAIGTIIVLCFMAYHEVKRYQAYKNWNVAYEHGAFFNHDKANVIYAQLYPTLRSNGLFLFYYGQSLYYEKDYRWAIFILEAAKQRTANTYLYTTLGSSYQALQQYKAAETNFKLASNLNPYRFYPRYLLAQLYQNTNSPDKALTIAREIISMDVKIPSSVVETIKQEMQAFINRQDSCSVTVAR